MTTLLFICMTLLFILEAIDVRNYKKLYEEYKKGYEDLAEAHRKLVNNNLKEYNDYKSGRI